MAKLVFPDGNVREYDNKTPLEIAESISVSFCKIRQRLYRSK